MLFIINALRRMIFFTFYVVFSTLFAQKLTENKEITKYVAGNNTKHSLWGMAFQ